MSQLQIMLLGGLMSMGAALIAGKTFRSLIIWPFAYLASRNKSSNTPTKVVQSIEQDLGIPDPLKQFANTLPIQAPTNNTSNNTTGGNNNGTT